MGVVKAVCFSDKRGIHKKNIQTAKFTAGWGMEGDIHGGEWHRQVSLISDEKRKDLNNKGADAAAGTFGENLIVEGIDFKNLPVGTWLQCNDVILEMTQIGKECRKPCHICYKMGECIMPKEGIFTKVVRGGKISVGDHMSAVVKGILDA